MALRAEIVDFVGTDIAQHLVEGTGIVKVAVVEKEAHPRFVRVHVKMVDPPRVEGRGAADDAVDFITFAEQKFRQVRAVLAGDAGD